MERKATRQHGGGNGTTLRRRARAVRRGSALLEVVLAGVLLGMVATSIVAILAYVHRSEARRMMMLGATELGNRLILQCIDDEKLMPSEHLPYDDGMFMYRWELVKRPVVISAPPNAIMESQGNNTAGAGMLSMTRVLEARVYKGVPDGVGGYTKGELLATLGRMHNPAGVSFTWNPDTVKRKIKDPAFLALISDIAMNTSGTSANTGTRSTVTPPRRTPPQVTRSSYVPPTSPQPAPASTKRFTGDIQ